jgi:hypothetical protein
MSEENSPSEVESPRTCPRSVRISVTSACSWNVAPLRRAAFAKAIVTSYGPANPSFPDQVAPVTSSRRRKGHRDAISSVVRSDTSTPNFFWNATRSRKWARCCAVVPRKR